MINVPISICINKGISQVYFLFISPKSTKHIPPNINILQCEYPRQSISIKTYTMPPKENKKKYFKTLAIEDMILLYVGQVFFNQRIITKVPAVIRIPPITVLNVKSSLRITKASIIDITTLNLSIGTTFDASPS